MAHVGDVAAAEQLLASAERPLDQAGPIHWHGIADCAALDARAAFDRGDPSLGVRWARCAVAIYDALASDIASPHSFALSGMYLRVFAIANCGVVPGDELLDPAVIGKWVGQALSCSVDEAVGRSSAWKHQLATTGDAPVEEARVLREMKNRLGVLAALGKVIELPSALRAWIDARSELV